MASVPLFSNFAKSFSDLLKKKHEPKHRATYKFKSDSLTVEAGLAFSDLNAVVGQVKGTLTQPWGEVEANVATDKAGDCKVKHTKLANGLTTTLALTSRPSGSLTAEYQTDRYSASGVIDGTGDSRETNVRTGGSFVVGRNGHSVGGGLFLNPKTQTLDDYGIGFESAGPNKLLLTVLTRRRFDVVSFSYYKPVENRDPGLKSSIGGQLDVDRTSRHWSYVLTFAGEHQISKETYVKTSFDSAGFGKSTVEHRLDVPFAMKLALTTRFNLTKRYAPDSWSLGVNFGEL